HNNRDGTFTDVAPQLGVTRPLSSYACWFWDFDNDGKLDLFVASYQGGIEAVAAGYLGAPLPEGTEFPCLYRGDGRGGFKEVAAEYGLTRPLMVMGANYGDLDNDGYLDFYLGTGYPEFEALMPKVMYHNQQGRRFVDVTFAGGFGHLQKGHGIAFADITNSGNQDVLASMGGAFRGDQAFFALYRNPGFGNHWIKVKLVGVKSNRPGIGARIRVDINDGSPRSIYRTVSSGGSFGSNPLRQEIGVGQAKVIERLEVHWPTSGITQTFQNVAVDQFVEVTEGREELRVLPLKPVKK
ncbi:MAG TPA: CRTAC1 family protein, partial [Planctomycetota bacterium]|nr:CRTAC1 family protein [Planctomycetota bacterium]